MNKEKKCPICGNKYVGYPAISRRDNKTEICPDCGIKEALEDWTASNSKWITVNGKHIFIK